MALANNLSPNLWHDCDAIYEQHQSLCLQLQDDHQLNVNLLLLAIWLDRQHQKLAPTHWAQLQQDVFVWEQKLLLPYRKLRRLSKTCLDHDEYQQMLSLELMLERKSQSMILSWLESMPLEEQTSTDTRDNLSHYLSLFDLDSHNIPSLRSH